MLSRRQSRYLYDRPDFDCAPACHGNPLGDGDRLVEIPGVDQEVAAQLFARLRKRTVGDESFALAYLDAGRPRRRVQWGGSEILPGRIDLVRKLHRLPVTLLPLCLGQGLLIAVNQQHVSHEFASILAKLVQSGLNNTTVCVTADWRLRTPAAVASRQK